MPRDGGRLVESARSGRFGVAALALASAALWAAPPVQARSGGPVAALPLGRVVLEAREAPGLRRTAARSASARRVLSDAVRLKTLPRFTAKTTQIARFRKGKTELSSIAFELKDPAFARLTARRIATASQGRRVAVGSAGYGFGPRPRVVVWARGQVLSAIVLDAALGPRVALDYARVADASVAKAVSRTAYGAVLERVGPRGTVSRRTALDLFALAYRPLPGTKRPPGPRKVLQSGTYAARHVLGLWKTLTPAQQAAARRALGIVDVRLTGRKKASAARRRDFGDPSFTPDVPLTKTAEQFAAVYSAKLHRPLNLTIVAGKSNNPDLADAYGDSLPLDQDGNYTANPTLCRIRISPAGDQQSAAGLLVTVAHETFHCMQFAIVGATTWTSPGSDWVGQGTAEWAALRVTNPPWVEAESFSTYFDTCDKTPLYARIDGSGVGFFGHSDDTVENFWDRIEAVVLLGFKYGNGAAYDAAHGSEDALLNTWASSALVAPHFGLPWTTSSPVTPPAASGCATYPLIGDSTVNSTPLTTKLYALEQVVYVNRPLLHVEITRGHARLTDGKFVEQNVKDDWFCLYGECECPAGTEGSPPPSPSIDLPAYVGLSGGKEAGAGSVTFVSLEQFCKEKQKPPPPPGSGGPGGGGGGDGGGGCGPSPSRVQATTACLPPPIGCEGVGCGYSSADPHLLPFGGVWYDFQAAGEFTAVRSTSGDLEAQVRQEPYAGSKYVSINTAAAMLVARHRVAVYHGRPLAVRVDGRAVLLRKKPLELPGGGTVAGKAGGIVDVTWPDGSVARVIPIGNYEVDLVISLAAARTGKVTGLLGNANGNFRDDFVTRRGRRLGDAAVRGQGRRAYTLLYRVFGDSWRVSRRGSLFDYARGQSTKTFTNRRFPAKLTSSSGLDPAARAKAARACRKLRITSARVRENCILDVASTGDFRFVTSAATVGRSGRRRRGRTPPPPPAADTRWTLLSRSAVTNSLLVVPSLALDAGKVVAAYVASDRVAEAATFTPSAKTDAAGLRRRQIAAGPQRLGNPQLLPRPGGGLQALVDGVPLQSVSFAPRNPDGRFGAAVTAAGDIHATAAGPAVLAPDGQPVWPAYYGGELRLWRGASGAVSVDLTATVAPPGSSVYIPAVGRDTAGRYWLAWFLISTRTPKQSGLYLARFDPVTLRLVGSPARAPGSESSVNNGVAIALACASTCRLAYVQAAGKSSRIATWTPGKAPAPVSGVGPTGQPTYRVAAAYTAKGRLWLSWWDVKRNRFVATHGNAAGAGGKLLAVGRPSGAVVATGALSAVATGETLVLVANWPGADGRSAARYVNVVAAPR